MTTWYKLADVFFFIFHVLLIGFNLFGWIPERLRKWNLLTLGLTAFSWFVLGIFYGFGYCFLTDWHWQIRDQLGYANPYNSYIHFLVSTIFSIDVSAEIVDLFTGILFAAAVIMSVITNVKSLKRKKLNRR